MLSLLEVEYWAIFTACPCWCGHWALTQLLGLVNLISEIYFHSYLNKYIES